jgi:hypothetical protein
MRGEFIGVWSETWREICTPLVDQENVPDDIVCELYRELTAVLRDPDDDDALALPTNDAIQLREAFERALVLAGIEIELPRAREAFEVCGATKLDDTLKRREAVENALVTLIGDSAKGVELLGQALSEFACDPKKRAEAKERARDAIVNDTVKSRDAFQRVQPNDISGERALVTFLEAVHTALEDLGGDELSNRYFNLLERFIEKFSLRYDLRRPCTLCPTLSGMFVSLVRDLRAFTSHDSHLSALMKEFEDAVRDLRYGCSDGRIKTCINKQFMLLEAMGAVCPGVTTGTLGDMCDQVSSWPHAAIRESLKKLYGFASDYPGIRHGTNPNGVIRTIEMRDMVAISILLAGFTPYLTDLLNADIVYRGS